MSGARQLAEIQDPNLWKKDYLMPAYRDRELEQKREALVADQVHEILLVLEDCRRQGFISEEFVSEI